MKKLSVVVLAMFMMVGISAVSEVKAKVRLGDVRNKFNDLPESTWVEEDENGDYHVHVPTVHEALEDLNGKEKICDDKLLQENANCDLEDIRRQVECLRAEAMDCVKYYGKVRCKKQAFNRYEGCLEKAHKNAPDINNGMKKPLEDSSL